LPAASRQELRSGHAAEEPASRKLTGFADAIGEETLDAANAEHCRRDPAA
jgi:hypothetical protein